MEMKDRVDNLLKVVRERIGEENSDMYELMNLRQRLEHYLEKIDMMDLKDSLRKEWDDIVFNHEVNMWDEAFLKVVANESITDRHQQLHDAYTTSTYSQSLVTAITEAKERQMQEVLERQIKLTSTQVKLAKKLGMSLEDYAKAESKLRANE